MSDRAVEAMLAARREGRDELPEEALALSRDEGVEYRNEGNLPDEAGRTLRLLLVLEPGESSGVEAMRSLFEPDYLDAPAWRREGSRSVNVIPVGIHEVTELSAWWDEEEMAAFETEWRARGTVSGVPVPGEYRSFVYKTVAALRRAGRVVTADSIAGSIARWVPPSAAAEVRRALIEAAED
jgi:hypothetical protein